MIPADLYRYTPEQRQALADDPNTPAELLRKLSKDSLAWVRISVAIHPNTPEPLARQLGKRMREIERSKC